MPGIGILPEDVKRLEKISSKESQIFAVLDELNKTGTKPFFLWHLYFADVFEEKGGFDIVIGNPPYIKERDNKKVFEVVNNSSFGRKYHQGKMDYWYYFLHLAIDITKKGAVITFITSRYWLNSYGAKNLIKRVSEELSFAEIVDIGKLTVFNEVAGQHMIGIYKKQKTDQILYKQLINNLSDIEINENTSNLQIEYLSNKKIFSDSNEIFLDSDNRSYADSIGLGEITDISQGVVEAPDKVSRKSILKFNQNNFKVGEGIFVLSDKEVEDLRLNDSEKLLLKRYLDPNDINRYYVKWSGKNLIYSDAVARNKIKNDKNFLNLKRHLDRYANLITSSNKPYGIHRPRDVKYFVNPKIIFKGMFTSNQFIYDEENYFVGFSFSLIIAKNPNFDLKYILSILNSKFVINWFYKRGKRRGGGIDIGVEKLRLFPIKITSHEEQLKFTNKVNAIMQVTDSKDFLENPDDITYVSKLEHEVDQMVYELYGLKDKEISEIENIYD